MKRHSKDFVKPSDELKEKAANMMNKLRKKTRVCLFLYRRWIYLNLIDEELKANYNYKSAA